MQKPKKIFIGFVFFIFVIIYLSNFVNAYGDSEITGCGGDDELIIGCLGNDELFFQGEYIFPKTVINYGGGVATPQINDFKSKLFGIPMWMAIIWVTLIFISIIILLISNKRFKKLLKKEVKKWIKK